MAWLALARVLLVAALAVTAAVFHPLPIGLVGNLAFSLLLVALTVVFETRLRQIVASHVFGALIGGTVGLVVAGKVASALALANGAGPAVEFFVNVFMVALTYVGLVLGAHYGEWLEPARMRALVSASRPERRYKILDTSVIIDGRISDVCETGFIDGTLVIPQFVLKELQLIADSAESLKRNRGRRGLDILQAIQKMAGIEVMISDVDFPDIREVDLKLIELARSIQGKIITNDFNLNKVAQLRGVDVLNVNELANTLKPVVLPGEMMRVFILKEGKEYNQGVAYLDDGTMVVVDNARKMISKTIEIVVTSVLQTTAGKMIFGRHVEPGIGSQLPHAGAADREDGSRVRQRQAVQPQQT
jgi:uncharacterized protein YacL